MMGINRRYAPGAMLNWGFALKERSRLRPANSTERISLLQQAKQLLWMHYDCSLMMRKFRVLCDM
ncbi:hypothetical protein KP509_02G038300 [Ceratopteris richardii]|uniref:Uncharacterized protein n=1 Tax=Ceratopteris richardii TaxID=49495 RepID=A0A8T2V4X2_CERRI|nr:hypothetical protein KP509_02G038300 [Ceratopteris richardii]